ncbi:MAG: hypothetical protein IJZ71_04985 [Treponema sp.]|nr:hypothetical protein [Treponema sp.]
MDNREIYEGTIVDKTDYKKFLTSIGFNKKAVNIIITKLIDVFGIGVIAVILLIGASVSYTPPLLLLLGFSIGGGFNFPLFLAFVGAALASLLGIEIANDKIKNRKIELISKGSLLMNSVADSIVLPCFIFISQQEESVKERMYKQLKQCLRDMGFTNDFCNWIIERYKNESTSDLKSADLSLRKKINSLQKKIPGSGKLYKDYKENFLIKKSKEIQLKINDCIDSVSKKEENQKFIEHQTKISRFVTNSNLNSIYTEINKKIESENVDILQDIILLPFCYILKKEDNDITYIENLCKLLQQFCSIKDENKKDITNFTEVEIEKIHPKLKEYYKKFDDKQIKKLNKELIKGLNLFCTKREVDLSVKGFFSFLER